MTVRGSQDYFNHLEEIMILLACGLLCLSVPAILVTAFLFGVILKDGCDEDILGPLVVLLGSLGATVLAILSLCLG